MYAVAELASDGPAMLVVHDARRLIHDLPATFPRQITEIRVFQVKRGEQRIESTQFQKLAPVEGTRSAASVKAGIQLLDRRFDPMPHAKAALLPPALSQPRFFTQLARVGEEDLAGDRKHVFVGESIQQRLQEIAFHAHVAVEQNNHVIARMLKSGIRATAESKIFFERDQPDRRETLDTRIPRCRRWTPSSTTITSLRGQCCAAATTAGRYFSSRSRPFQLGITMLARARGGLRRGREVLSRPKFRNEIGQEER